MRDPIVGDFGNVDQALDAILDPGEGAEVRELRHGTANQLTNFVLGRNPAPRLGLRALDRKSDLLLLRVDAKHVDVDFLADLEDLAWVPNAAPAELREVNQSVGSSDVDECTEVANRGNATLTSLAFLEFADQALLHLVAAFLNGLALRENEAIPVAVDLDDLERKARTDQAGHLGLLGGIVTTADFRNLRCRHETAHAVEIHQQATLVVVGDLGLDDVVRFVDLLKLAPALLLAGSIDRNDRVAFLILWLDDEDEDVIADRQGVLLFSRQAGEFAGRNDAFRLRSDIDQDLIPVKPHDHPVDDIAVLQRLVPLAGVAEILLHKQGAIEFFGFRAGHVRSRRRLHRCHWGRLQLFIARVRGRLLANVRRAVHTPSLKANTPCRSLWLRAQ